MNLTRTMAAGMSILVCLFGNYVAAQSLIAGSIAGTVADPSSAVVPNAVVALLSLDTGETQSTNTNVDGVYGFTQLKPGHYQVTVTMPGFAKIVTTTSVNLGETTPVDLTLKISKEAETIEVTAGAPLVSTDPGVVTSFTPTEVALFGHLIQAASSLPTDASALQGSISALESAISADVSCEWDDKHKDLIIDVGAKPIAGLPKIKR